MGIKEYILIGASILLIIIIITLILVLRKRPKLKKIIKDKKDLGNLIEITYSNSGDSNGNTDFVSLDIKKMKIVTEYRTTHSDPLKVKEYKVNNIDKILDYINKYNIPAWNVLPIDTDIIVYDAPIKSIIFSYEKDNKINYYTIDFNMMIEPFGRDILNDFVKEFLLLKKKENLIKEYTKKE